MNKNTLKAKKTLYESECTLVFCKDDEIHIDCERGVKTLLRFVNDRKNFFGYSVADKVVGKAAAYLYVILGIEELYADVISKSALDVLAENDIDVFYKTAVDRIRNRSNTGFCPMEDAVMDSKTSEEALVAINEKFRKLNALGGE